MNAHELVKRRELTPPAPAFAPERTAFAQPPCAVRSAPGPGRFGHDFGRVQVQAVAPMRVQAKLIVGQPEDVYEQEAERVAAQVTSEPAHDLAPPRLVPAALPPIQRLGAEFSPALDDGVVADGQPKTEEETPAVQSLAQTKNPSAGRDPGAEPPPNWERRLASSGHTGQPLAPGVLQYMGDRFNANFSNVRVHSDSMATELSAGIRARAFTHGAHVYFAPGEYCPQTDAGRKVLAHELTHVIQQGAARSGAFGPVSSDLSSPGQAAAPIQRLAELNKTSAANLVQANVAPWGQAPPSGDKYQVSTDAGSQVESWVAYGGNPESQRYWCHGFSLGTYARDGYSVYSGTPMQKVIADEWTAVAPSAAVAGDIVVFLPNYDHSARFTSVVTAGSALDETASRLDTKNGQNALKNDNLDGIKTTYPNRSYRCFHHR